jgi:hypothetical protein
MLSLCKLNSNDYTLVDMISVLSDDAKQRIIKNNPSGVDYEVAPILFSIKRSTEENVPNTWKQIVSNSLGFEVDKPMNNIADWALLMYFECMLMKIK